MRLLIRPAQESEDHASWVLGEKKGWELPKVLPSYKRKMPAELGEGLRLSLELQLT